MEEKPEIGAATNTTKEDTVIGDSENQKAKAKAGAKADEMSGGV